MKKSFWKILRILTTNQCNYRCLYCHNEGQEKDAFNTRLSFDNFIRIAHVVEGMGFQEVRFSGGEPLVNPETIKMIEWLDTNSDYEIGLATNGSMITEDVAKRISETRTLVTIHYPSVKDTEYKRVTGMNNSMFKNAVERMDRYGIKHSFNFVLYPDTINNMTEVVDEVIKKGKRVKLLPYIEDGFNNFSKEIMEKLEKTMDGTAETKTVFSDEGIITWTFPNGGKVKLLESPCYDHNIDRCREYGELRLLPDLSLQKCIFDNESVSLKDLSDDEVRETISEMWKSFNKCL